MLPLLKLGRAFYGVGIIAIGVHQIILRDFRPDILPSFPSWAHEYGIFPIVVGLGLIISGVLINTNRPINRQVSLGLGYFFLFLIVTCHLPYLFLYIPDKLSQLQYWFAVGETLAYAGGAFVIAGSFGQEKNWTGFAGSIFYAILILIFGCSHFVYTAPVSAMVPKYLGAPLFWTYFVGVALIGASIALILRIWVKTVSLLLAIMLFLFFLLFHIPDAIANPSVGSGNEIVRAIIALLFCGIALTISTTREK